MTSPAACVPQCSASTYAAVAAAHGITDVDPSDWLTADTIAAIQYWTPPNAIDPGATASNVMLADLRALSPAYALTGPLRTHRMLPLTSLGDHVVTDQLAGSNAPADLYLARLQATGVTIPDPVPVVHDTTCGHGDYINPARPQCGFQIILDEARPRSVRSEDRRAAEHVPRARSVRRRDIAPRSPSIVSVA